jgi:hypothetical protein
MPPGRFAAGGAGLVVVESTKIERRGCGTVGDLGLWDDTFIPGFKRIVDPGARVRRGLRHPARPLGPQGARRPAMGRRPATRTQQHDSRLGCVELVAPSALAADAASPVPRALSISEIRDTIQAWGHAAARAMRRASTWSRSMARMVTCCTSFFAAGQPAPMRMAVRPRSGCDSRWRWPSACAAAWPEDNPVCAAVGR